MAELLEVETVCLALKPVLEGDIFVRIQTNHPDLQCPLYIPTGPTTCRINPLKNGRKKISRNLT